MGFWSLRNAMRRLGVEWRCACQNLVCVLWYGRSWLVRVKEEAGEGGEGNKERRKEERKKGGKMKDRGG